MKRFKNILYYSDGKDAHRPALRIAMDLARSNQARLTVLGVIERFHGSHHIHGKVDSSVDLHDLALRDFRTGLEHLTGPMRDGDVPVEVDVRWGTPFLEVIRAVLMHKYDLVMLASDGKGGKQQLLGSTGLRLMRKCPCPVWVVNESHRKFKRILAAVNPDPYDEEHQGVNRQVMELATSLTRIEKSELQIVHVWNVQGEEALRRWHIHLPAETVDRVVAETEEDHRTWLNDLLAKHSFRGIPHKIHMPRGAPCEKIISLAAKNRIDLIVMGTVGRSGIPGFIMGNTAETVLANVRCSVLAVKPDGFVTPVKPDEDSIQI